LWKEEEGENEGKMMIQFEHIASRSTRHVGSSKI